MTLQAALSLLLPTQGVLLVSHPNSQDHSFFSPASVPCSAPPSSELPSPFLLLMLSNLPDHLGPHSAQLRSAGGLPVCWPHLPRPCSAGLPLPLSTPFLAPTFHLPETVHRLLRGLCSLFWEVQYKCFRLRAIKVFPSKPVTLCR